MPSPRSRSRSPRSLGNLLSRRPPSPTPPPAPGAADELGRASSDPTNSSSDPIRSVGFAKASPPPPLLVSRSSSSLADAGKKIVQEQRVVRAFKPSQRETVVMRFGRVGMTPLLAECAKGNAARVGELLAEFASNGDEAPQAELTAVDDWAGSTALHWAAYKDSSTGKCNPLKCPEKNHYFHKDLKRCVNRIDYPLMGYSYSYAAYLDNN